MSEEKECCRMKNTPRQPETVKSLQNRISRLNGQLNGIGRMIDDNRYCGDILIQIAAVEQALQNLGYVILQEHMNTCVTEQVLEGNEQIMDETMDLIRRLK